MSYEEAAAICQCPVGTVKSRVSRARQQLMQPLSPEPVQSNGFDSSPAEGNADDSRPNARRPESATAAPRCRAGRVPRRVKQTAKREAMRSTK
jgi:hypothetical protein